MKNKTISMVVILLISTSIFLVATKTTNAQSVIPGVAKAETFDYSYSLIWTSTNPSAIPPSDLVEYNNTQKIEFKITDVSGAKISVDFIRDFYNGSQTVQSGSIDVESGTVTVPYGFLIVGANLAKNQQVFPTGGHQMITDTVMRTYPSGQRETNVISGEDSSQKTAIYYDKIKGIAVDYSYSIYETSGSYFINSTETMVNTNSDAWALAPGSTPTATSADTNPTLTPTATATSQSPNPSTTKPSPTSNSGANAPSIDKPQQSTTLIIIVAVIVIVIALGIVTVALRKKKKPLSESDQILQSLKK